MQNYGFGDFLPDLTEKVLPRGGKDVIFQRRFIIKAHAPPRFARRAAARLYEKSGNPQRGSARRA
jgi:hypothetical protein